MVAGILIFIIDLSGFSDTLLALSSRVAGRTVTNLRPFTCSLCMVFWAGLFVALVRGQLSIPVVLYICALAYFSRTISSVLILIQEALEQLIANVADWLKL